MEVYGIDTNIDGIPYHERARTLGAADVSTGQKEELLVFGSDSAKLRSPSGHSKTAAGPKLGISNFRQRWFALENRVRIIKMAEREGFEPSVQVLARTTV